jgi:hypothetical protein
MHFGRRLRARREISTRTEPWSDRIQLISALAAALCQICRATISFTPTSMWKSLGSTCIIIVHEHRSQFHIFRVQLLHRNQFSAGYSRLDIRPSSPMLSPATCIGPEATIVGRHGPLSPIFLLLMEYCDCAKTHLLCLSKYCCCTLLAFSVLTLLTLPAALT